MMVTVGPVGTSVDGGGPVVVGGTVVVGTVVVVGGTVVVVGGTVVVGTVVVVGGTVVVVGGPVVDGALPASAVADGACDVGSSVVDADSNVAEVDSARAARSSTIEGDGVGGMTIGGDVGVGFVTEVELATGIGLTKTGSAPCARHTRMNPKAMTPISSNQNEVGSRGNDHRARCDPELRRAPPAIGGGFVTALAAASAGTGQSESAPRAIVTGLPVGCGQMFGCCGPRSQTDPFSDTWRT
jgi:hypothetical protein